MPYTLSAVAHRNASPVPDLLAPCRALIHRSAWKENSQKSISTILHGLPLWERRMAYFPALELVAKHKLLEQ